MTPAVLDHAGIAARIPHQGAMCLLARLESWSDAGIHCTAASHRDAANPLRTASGLLAPCAIEYAAQAMALHGALRAPAGQPPSPGYLASVRDVRFARARLDDVDGPLHVRADFVAGDHRQLLYRFAVADDAGAVLAEGRATVVLNTPLPPAPQP
jgi:predicted hotdog family 3-hydroxylacyl-ACP dehydratase